jgi:hypothetical protein
MRRIRPIIVLVLASGCTTLVGSAAGPETSTDAEPPRAWESAVLFQFRDSTSDPGLEFAARVELGGAATPRTVTGDDVYLTESNLLRTPWYRLRLPPAELRGELMIQVVLEHPSGDRSVADYPLTITRDEFYYVSFGVGTRQAPQPHLPDRVRELRSYPVPAEARQQTSDSLWIGYYTRGRYCFSCPG